MATIEQIDRDKPLSFYPYQNRLDVPPNYWVPVEELEDITIMGTDVHLFLDWVASSSWRQLIEQDLQGSAEDEEGLPLLDTLIPLVTFRDEICAGGRQLQDQQTQLLMERLRNAVLGWRDAGAELVNISGYEA